MSSSSFEKLDNSPTVLFADAFSIATEIVSYAEASDKGNSEIAMFGLYMVPGISCSVGAIVGIGSEMPVVGSTLAIAGAGISSLVTLKYLLPLQSMKSLIGPFNRAADKLPQIPEKDLFLEFGDKLKSAYDFIKADKSFAAYTQGSKSRYMKAGLRHLKAGLDKMDEDTSQKEQIIQSYLNQVEWFRGEKDVSHLAERTARELKNKLDEMRRAICSANEKQASQILVKPSFA